MLKTKVMKSILLAGAILLLSVFACCALWKPVLLPALQSADWGESYVLPSTKVPLDLNALPAKPTEEDFALLATQLLEHESGRTGFYPTFMTWTMLCSSNVHTPSKVYVGASWHTSFGSFRGYLNGQVKLWPRSGEAELEIWDGGKESFEYPPIPGLDFDEPRGHIDDVLPITEDQGGYEFRQAIENQCEITLRLSATKPEWLIEYRSLTETNYFCMTMERQTGIYTTTLSTTECKW